MSAAGIHSPSTIPPPDSVPTAPRSPAAASFPQRAARTQLAPAWIIGGCIAAVSIIGFAVSIWGSGPKNFGVVDEGKIYRSGELTPSSLARVASDHRIRTIIDLGAFEPGTGEEARMQRAADALGITRYSMDLEGDATGNPNWYVQALRIMNDPARQPVLVHCSAGTQRTGCLVMLHRHIVEGKPYSDVFHEAVEHRHDPKSNPHLLLMIAEWSERIAESYRSGKPIPGVDAIPEAIPEARTAP